MIVIKTACGIAALVLLLGVIGEKDAAKQKNIALAYAATMALFIALEIGM